MSILKNVHPTTACAGEHCVVHNPSDHHTRRRPLVWPGDKSVFERTCPHGIGHLDPDDAAFLVRIGPGHLTIHGYDMLSCCEDRR
ncbi:hypothetical protein [Geodermatophilus sp. URMC 63]